MKVTLKSLINEAMKDIDKADKEVRIEASKHLIKKMKEKVSDKYFKGYHSQPGEPPGSHTGNLKKGIGYADSEKNHETKVGVGPPAYHAHLMEFGTDVRFVKGKNVGRVLPRPFVLSTFDEETEAVKRILSRKWI